jgi:uncharacterized Zn-binding protein involved in type VI secretion
MHACPVVGPGNVPHTGGPVPPREATVFIGCQPAARKGDKVVCVGPEDEITEGSSTVKIEGKPAARLGDRTAHGGKVTAGHPKVKIGGDPQGAALMKAGAPLVKPCEDPNAPQMV